jgi:hypothetical protein
MMPPTIPSVFLGIFRRGKSVWCGIISASPCLFLLTCIFACDLLLVAFSEPRAQMDQQLAASAGVSHGQNNAPLHLPFGIEPFVTLTNGCASSFVIPATIAIFSPTAPPIPSTMLQPMPNMTPPGSIANVANHNTDGLPANLLAFQYGGKSGVDFDAYFP